MKICCVSPTYFAPESAVGGGERYAEELARALAEAAGHADVKLVSFGPRAFRERPLPRLERVVLKSWTTRDPLTPFAPSLARELAGADVVHCFQYHTLPTFLASLLGRLAGRRVFVSDLGGGGWTPGYQIDQSRWITAHLPISKYAARGLPGRNRRFRVLGGGVDPGRYPLRPEPAHDGSALFLGRILPHKGVHVLLEGLPAEVPLDVVGPAADPPYLERLRTLAAGKTVRFHHGLADAEVARFLQTSMALVHATPVDAAGRAGVNELFGLALVEAMSCGCPVIASRAASLPEIVADGETGLLVPPNDPAAIGRALRALGEDPELWRRLSAGARRAVEERFTWNRVAERCLAAYSEPWS